MPKVSIIEKRVFDVEGFEIDITQNGRNIRDDLVLPKQYEAARMSKNSMTVSEWKDKFSKQFPGYEVNIYDGAGNKARGQMKLSTVRDSYLDE